MPTPDIYALGMKPAFSADLPVELKTANANILYATDRIPAPREDGRLDYGTGRDHSLAFGEAVVRFGADTTWKNLEADARTHVRSTPINLEVGSVTERARGPKGAVVFYGANGTVEVSEQGRQHLESTMSKVRELVQERLEIAPRKELLIFVHGVANTFDDALYATAELWHYLGREFVPIAYSWPAGRGGMLRGYTYDRESSEFTVFHFKRFLAWLATFPEVDGIHVIGHSRGTDVVLTSLRELTIEARAQGITPSERYKLRNVVIAAPDINLEVTLQRTEREGTRWVADRWTTYSSPGDKAIGISEWLFSGGRFGRARYDELDEIAQMWVDQFEFVDSSERDAVVQYEGKSGGLRGHSYFRTNPAVASDLVLAVRYGLPPGTENGRPLENVRGLFWRINDDYLTSENQQ